LTQKFAAIYRKISQKVGQKRGANVAIFDVIESCWGSHKELQKTDIDTPGCVDSECAIDEKR
jgi:hypothetical protein